MATNSMIPYSNPGGNNQTTPGAGMPKAVGMPILPMGTPQTTAPVANPLVPPGVGAVPSSAGGVSIPNVGGLVNSPTNTAGTTGGLDKQLVDIYGKGVGGALDSLLTGMSGTDSQILQEYIASLQPQEAKAQANVNASLGAGGVSANSSVAGLADANLQAQEFSAIAGESANLTQSQEQLTAQLLQGMQPAAQKEVATSNWSIFGDVMGDIATDVGAVLHGGQGAKPGSVPASPVVGAAASTIGSAPGSVPGMTGANDLDGSIPVDMGLDIGDSLPAFA